MPATHILPAGGRPLWLFGGERARFEGGLALQVVAFDEDCLAWSGAGEPALDVSAAEKNFAKTAGPPVAVADAKVAVAPALQVVAGDDDCFCWSGAGEESDVTPPEKNLAKTAGPRLAAVVAPLAGLSVAVTGVVESRGWGVTPSAAVAMPFASPNFHVFIFLSSLFRTFSLSFLCRTSRLRLALSMSQASYCDSSGRNALHSVCSYWTLPFESGPIRT